MPLVALGLGGNLGGETAILERFSAVRTTVEDMLDAPVRASSVYRTAPLGPVQEQPDFLNAALACESDLAEDPVVLMAVLLDLESLLGRRRTQEVGGPRLIDIDLLLYGDLQLSLAAPIPLFVPHPRLIHRDFVLSPLIDVLGEDHLVPGTEMTLGGSRERLGDQGARRTELSF